MKLLYLTEDKFPPFRADVVELFAKSMPLYGNRIDWFMQQNGKENISGIKQKWLGNIVWLIPKIKLKGTLGRILNTFLVFLCEWLVIPLALWQRYDVIQVRDKHLSCIPAIIAAKLSGANFCFWMSYPFPESRIYLAKNNLTSKKFSFLVKGYLTYYLLYRFIVKHADKIFVQSKQMYEDVCAAGVAPEKLSVVLMGIKSSQVKRTIPNRYLNTDIPELLYLGTLVRIRQLDFLVRVLKKVHSRYPRARLVFVGDGENPEDRALIENEVKALHLENFVEFTGFLKMEEAWKRVEKTDICFSPFYPTPVLLSTSPTKLIEYLALGKNVVANEHPEQQTVLEESGAGNCVPWDENAFAQEIFRLLSDPQKSFEEASKGPEYVMKYRTYDTISNQVNEAYKGLLNES